MSPIEITRFAHARDNRGELLSFQSWSDFVGWLGVAVQHTAPKRKDAAEAKKTLPAIGPYILHEGTTRSLINVAAVTVGALDVDHLSEDALNSLQDRIEEQQLAAVVHTSPSDSPEERKVRVYVPLARPLTPEESWPFRVALAERLGVEVDPSTKDPCRIFFAGALHNTPARELFEFRGAKADVNALLSTVLPARAAQNPRVLPARAAKHLNFSGVTSGSRLCPEGEHPENYAIRLARVAAPAIEGASGHTALFDVACDLVVGLGLTPERALDVLADEYNPRCDPPWDLQDDAQWHDFERKVREAAVSSKRPLGYLLPMQQQAQAAMDPDVDPLTLLGEVVDLAAPIQPLQWRIDNVCAPGKVTILVARPEGGKSPLALWMALCVASGLSVFEERQDPALQWQVAQCPVIYLDFETGDLAVERLQRMCNALGVEREGLPLYFVHAEHALEPQLLYSLERACAVHSVGFVVIDTYASALSGDIDYNSGQFAHYLRELGKLSRALRVTIVVLMHARKGENESIEAVSGNFGAVGAGQTILHLIPEDDTLIKVVCARSPRKKWEPFYVRWEDIEQSESRWAGVSLTGTPWGLMPAALEASEVKQSNAGNDRKHAEAQAARDQARRRIVAELQRCARSGLTASYTDLELAGGAGVRAAKEVLAALVEEGHVMKLEKRCFRLRPQNNLRRP